MQNKFNEAVGLFWGAVLFIGVLTTVIIGFCDNGFGWLFAGLVGGCVFLISGLVVQGVLALVGKNKNEDNTR